jgi:hypothetical protein
MQTKLKKAQKSSKKLVKLRQQSNINKQHEQSSIDNVIPNSFCCRSIERNENPTSA